MNRGFTLFETIIYIALLSMIMGMALIITFNILDGEGRISASGTAQDEGNFVLRKISWALSGVPALSSFGGYPSMLSVIKQDGTQINLRLNSGKIEVRTGVSGTYLPITTDNVTVSSLQFHYIPASGSGPSGIEASTTINGKVFYTKNYLRK